MEFKAETFLNPYLPAGASRIDAIVTVTADAGGRAAGARPVIGFLLDASGSMEGERINAVKQATHKALTLLDESSWFFVVRFSGEAELIYPLAQATAKNKADADARLRKLAAAGATMMSKALDLAAKQFRQIEGAIPYALFLTDGKNNDEDEALLEAALTRSEGVFQCDCRGVGADWQPRQLKRISRKLLGNARIIAEPSGIEADFRDAIEGAMKRSISDVRLRLWTPKSAKVLGCKQMNPEIVALTDRAVVVDAQTRDYPTGAWSAEARDYYIAVEMPPGDPGDEVLACRPSVVYGAGASEVKTPGAPIIAAWTEDEELSARINEHVAHYTGQEELAQQIQRGLEARARGDLDEATKALGRAAKLAHESGNEETTRRLARVVEIVDADEGTVRLKSRVEKAYEMDLDLSSTRTAPVRRNPKS